MAKIKLDSEDILKAEKYVGQTVRGYVVYAISPNEWIEGYFSKIDVGDGDDSQLPYVVDGLFCSKIEVSE